MFLVYQLSFPLFYCCVAFHCTDVPKGILSQDDGYFGCFKFSRYYELKLLSPGSVTFCVTHIFSFAESFANCIFKIYKKQVTFFFQNGPSTSANYIKLRSIQMKDESYIFKWDYKSQAQKIQTTSSHIIVNFCKATKQRETHKNIQRKTNKKNNLTGRQRNKESQKSMEWNIQML